MSVNQAMKEARLRAELSQNALAYKVGVSRQTINAIESGEHNPTIQLCIRICKELNVTLNDLFWDEA